MIKARPMLRWFLIGACVGLGTYVLVAIGWPLIRALDFDLAHLGFWIIVAGLVVSIAGVSFRWAWLLFRRRDRDFGSSVCMVVTIVSTLAVLTLPVWRIADEKCIPRLEESDLRPLVAVVALVLLFAPFLAAIYIGRKIHRWGQAWLSRVFGELPPGQSRPG